MTKKKSGMLFEDSLAEIEQLVSQLEQGDISLEDSLKSFERGVNLTRVCQKALQDAEQKVQILIEKNGTPASPATARAIRVLPHPGGPTSKTPLGIFPPSL